MFVPDAKAFWLPEPTALAAWLPDPMDDTLPEPDATLSNAELKLLKKSAGNCIHSVCVSSHISINPASTDRAFILTWTV